MKRRATRERSGLLAVLVGAMVGGLALFMTPASAAPPTTTTVPPPNYPLGAGVGPTITISSSFACVGGIFEITITGLLPFSPVHIYLHLLLLRLPPVGLTACSQATSSASAGSAGLEVRTADVHAAAGGTFNTNEQTVLIASGFADSSGTFNTKATIPDNTAPGYHQITADVTNASGQAQTLSREILVLPKTSTAVLSEQVSGKQAVPGDLARTGSNSIIPLAVGAGILIMAGGVLVLATRRRRTRIIS